MAKKGKGNARFGSRYGTKIRKRVSAVERKYKYIKQKCPFCGEEKVTRVAAGIYVCDSCGKKFAGGAYEPATLARRVLGKIYDKTGKVLKSKLEILELENAVKGE